MDERIKKILKHLKAFGWKDGENAIHPNRSFGYGNDRLYCRRIFRTGTSDRYIALSPDDDSSLITIWDAWELVAIVDSAEIVIPESMK